MDSATPKPVVICLGIDDKLMKFVSEAGRHSEIISEKYVAEKIGEPFSTSPAVIICGTPPEEISLVEVAQSLKMTYQEQPIYYLTEVRKGFNRKGLVKNGFTDAFFLPSDLQTFKDKFSIVLSGAGIKETVFRPVQLIDVTPGAKLGFDLYLHLPANNRKVRYASATEALDPKRAENLKKHAVTSVLVTADQMPQFYKFSADRLRELGNNKAISETERKERRETAVRDLLSGLFGDSGREDNIGTGRELMGDCQEIVKSFLLTGEKKQGGWYEKLMQLSATNESAYSHSSNVGTLAVMMAIGLGIGNAEEVALAGLLHDIGMAEVPLEVVMKAESERTPFEKALYHKHPQSAVDLIMTRKMLVPEMVKKIILQHHEKFAGGGYPVGLRGADISIEAQVLAVADEIDYMTRVQEGKLRLKHADAIRTIADRCLSDPTKASYDPHLIKNICSLFAIQIAPAKIIKTA